MSALAGRISATGKNNELRFRLLFTLILAMTVAYSLTSCSKRESAEPVKGNVAPKTFASPQAAGQALFNAAKTGDQSELIAIFGSDGRDLIFSGDAVAVFLSERTSKVWTTQRARLARNVHIGPDATALPRAHLVS